MVKNVSGNEFNEEIKEGLVVVDFYADWCGPCKMMAPVFKELAEQFEGKVKFIKVDVDANQQLSQEYGVTSIPTVIYFKDGHKKDTQIGFIPKDTFEANIKKFL